MWRDSANAVSSGTLTNSGEQLATSTLEGVIQSGAVGESKGRGESKSRGTGGRECFLITNCFLEVFPGGDSQRLSSKPTTCLQAVRVCDPNSQVSSESL